MVEANRFPSGSKALLARENYMFVWPSSLSLGKVPRMPETLVLTDDPDAKYTGFREHDPRINYFVKGAPNQNFGDYLPEILAKEFMLHPRAEADIYRLVGSVIDSAWILRDLRHSTGSQKGHIAFWCCGSRTNLPLDPKIQAMCSFFGVRGPLTRDLLKLPENTVLGDPGLLAPLFHAPSKLPGYENRIVCVPHIHDAKPDAELLRISGADLVLRPEIAATELGLRQILNKIASASFVLTGALHGAIIACAYGRPFAFWDNGHVDIPFKWQDFARSVNIPCTFVENAAEGRRTYRDLIAPRLLIPPLSPILEVCPFFIRPSALLRALSHDGRLHIGDARVAAQALENLDCFRPDTVYRLQDWSARHRAHHDKMQQIIRVRVGRAKEAVKNAIKKIAFAGLPGSIEVAPLALFRKDREAVRRE